MFKVTPLGDLHNGKQTELVQTEKETFIKKPRDFKTEVAFSLFCQKLESLGISRFSRTALLISEGDGYHTEALEENLPISDYGVDTYYHRAGILLCICYLFGSVDIHCENLIASGDMPVIIDTETLLSGKKRRSTNHYSLADSVLCSHLLCNFAITSDGAKDVSGFSGVMNGLKNIPHTENENKKIFPWDKTDIILSGFREAYNIIVSNKEAVREALHLFDDCSFRQILRPTQTYHTLSEKLGSLSEDKRNFYASELLSYAYKRDTDPNRLEKSSLILAEEERCVVSGEIPLFYAKGNSTDLFVRNKKVFPDFLESSPVNYAIHRLEEFCEDDLERQQKIISLALQASTPLKCNKTLHINTSSLTAGEICAKQVTDSAIFSLPSVFGGLEQSKSSVNFVSSGFSLYSGLCGVMCMYAALYRKTRKNEYYNTLQKCFESFAKIMLSDTPPIKLTDKSSGLGDGITGMFSALLHIHELTALSEFREAAVSLINCISVSEDSYNTDYLNGIGALPVILKRHQIPESDKMCSGFYKETLNTKPFTTGFAHGASGLALSLSALSALGLPVPDDAISALLSWENSYFIIKNGNWQDLRNAPEIGFMSGWCSGAPGIGMARKEMLGLINGVNLRSLCEKDISLSAEFIAMETPSKRDSLCCGTASRLMAASRLGIRIDKTFEQLFAAEKENSLRFIHPADTADINISLMQGLSGVAYALAMYGDPLSGGMLL